MMQNQKVRFKICIIGVGSVGGMLLEGLLNAAGDLFSPRDVILVTRRKDQEMDHVYQIHNIQKEHTKQIVVTQNLKWALKQSDLIFISVLPSQFQYLDFETSTQESIQPVVQNDASLHLMENLNAHNG